MDDSGTVRTPPMTFAEAVASVFRNWQDFEGRSRRSEYWWFFTLEAGVVLVASLMGVAAVVVVGVVLIVPYLAVAVRRMHDTGRSGAWVFWLLFAPWLVVMLGWLMVGSATTLDGLMTGLVVVGAMQLVAYVLTFVAIVLLVLAGDPGSNRYGPSPAHVPVRRRQRDSTT